MALPEPYPHTERRRTRAVIRQIEGFAQVGRVQAERGLTLEQACLAVTEEQRNDRPLILDPAQVKEQMERLTKTSDLPAQIVALDRMADQFQERHLERLYPLAAAEFNAFCEIMIPEEPPESAWHLWLTDTLQDIENDPKKGRFILNCPPGHAKPLHIETPVLMGDGSWKLLGAIEVGDTVISDTGAIRKVTAVHDQGLLPLLRVETQAGRVIHAAGDHSFRVGMSWKQAQDLRPGDPLEIIGSAPLLPYQEMDVNLAALAAWWCAYGSNSSGVTPKGKAITNPHVWVPGEAQARQVKAALDALGRAYKIHPVRYEGKEPGYAVRITPSKNLDLVDWLGLDQAAVDRRVPADLFAADDEAVRTFLHVFLSARAECPKRFKTPRLVCYMRSTALARDLQRLLARFGVSASLDLPPEGFGGRAALELDTAGIGQLIGSGIGYSGRYADRLDGIEAIEQDSFLDPVRRVLPDGEGLCKCLTVAEDHTFLAEGVVVHNSTYASRLYVVWRMGRNPNLQVIGGGHSQTFVENEFSSKNRDLIGMPAFQRVFPGVVVNHSQRAKGQWRLSGSKGQYVAKGVGQGVHGFRANFVVIDDPYAKIEDAESPAYREKVRTWFLTDIGTRLLPGGKIFVIMTRFHEEDLTGTLLDLNSKYTPEKRYLHVAAPAICFDPESDLLSRPLGEVLWDYYDINEFVDKRVGQKYQRFALIYQQLADAASEGSITGKFKYYERPPHKTDAARAAALEAGQVDDLGRPKVERSAYFRRVVLSVDTATKDTQRADWTVAQVWGETHDRKHYLLAQVRKKVEFTDLVTMIESTAKRWDVDYILVEDKGNGTAYIQARGRTEFQRRVAPAPIIPISTPSNQGKAFRFDEITPMIEVGDVYLPENADWLDLFIREVGQFPEGNNDDQVDAMTQYLRWAKSKRSRYGSKKVGSMG